jgi:hypothetical protein
MTVVSNILFDISKLDNLNDGVIVRLKTADGTNRCAVAESTATGRVWRVSGIFEALSSDDLLELGTVVVLYLPEITK